MATDANVPVLIVGAGPVGLSLAIELGRRAVGCLVIDEAPDTKTRPRAISIGPRSMEFFRRWGIADAVIDAGVPRAMPTDMVYLTRLLGFEVMRFPSPSADEAARRTADVHARVPDFGSSPYYRTWCGQVYLERVLHDHAATFPSVTIRFGWRLESLSDDGDGVDCRIREVASGRTRTVRAGHVAGCDGARSAVRKAIGVELEGRGTLGEVWGIHFHAPALYDHALPRSGVLFNLLAPGCAGILYTIDGRREFWFNKYFAAGETFRDIDPAAEVRAAIGGDVPFTVIDVQRYKAQQLVAARYGVSRALLAGDAAHLFVPTGGLGMNTGIDDAVNLGWKLAAAVQGWGGTALLDSYERERRPIGVRNTRQAAINYERSRETYTAPGEIEDPGAAGEVLRRDWAETLHRTKYDHHAVTGAQLGSHYDSSPLTVSDGTAAPDDDFKRFRPSARPGCRAPHLWLADGRSTLDLLGDGFTVLRLGPDAPDGSAIAHAARRAGVPLSVADVPDEAARALYAARLVLVRPDGHVAWRGNEAPADAVRLIDTVRGAEAVLVPG